MLQQFGPRLTSVAMRVTAGTSHAKDAPTHVPTIGCQRWVFAKTRGYLIARDGRLSHNLSFVAIVLASSKTPQSTLASPLFSCWVLLFAPRANRWDCLSCPLACRERSRPLVLGSFQVWINALRLLLSRTLDRRCALTLLNWILSKRCGHVAPTPPIQTEKVSCFTLETPTVCLSYRSGQFFILELVGTRFAAHRFVSAVVTQFLPYLRSIRFKLNLIVKFCGCDSLSLPARSSTWDEPQQMYLSEVSF